MDRENGPKGMMEAEAGVMQPQGKECLKLPEVGKRQGRILPRGIVSCVYVWWW